MIWSLCSLVLLLQPAPHLTMVPTEAQQPAEDAPVYDEGPLAVAVVAIFDARYWFEHTRTGTRESEMRMQIRISGEDIKKIVRAGEVIFTEVVDDTGKSLVDPQSYTEEQKTQTRPVNAAPERLREQGLMTGTRFGSPARGAKTVKLVGSVRVVKAADREEVTIDNPLQYVGQTIENPRLKELGIEVKVVPVAELPGSPPPADQMIALQYLRGDQQIAGIKLLDGWMKPVRYRERPMNTMSGDPVAAYLAQGSALDENTQLVLEVFPHVEETEVKINLDAVRLP